MGIDARDNRDNKVSNVVLVYYGLFSLVAMLFVTQSSPLYPMNYWDDTNIYHTVAKCILNGKVLYVDVHEQKGLITFIMELPGVIISRNSFFGLYLTEAAVFFFYSLFSLKIVSLFTRTDRIITTLIPVFALTSFSSPYFRYGGCIEELLLPFTTYVLYLGLRTIKTDVMFTKKDALIIGFICSWVFWTKIINCGIFLGFVIFVIVYAIMRKDSKKILPLAGFFLIGFLLLTIVVTAYFVVN